jgi:hypothetical protein
MMIRVENGQARPLLVGAVRADARAYSAISHGRRASRQPLWER